MAIRANFGPPEGGEFMHEISTFSLRLGFRGIVLQVCLRNKLVWDKKLGYVGYKLCGHMIPSVFFSSDHFDFEVVFHAEKRLSAENSERTAQRSTRFGM